jgi:hypothetical protein
MLAARMCTLGSVARPKILGQQNMIKRIIGHFYPQGQL